jgi:DNA-binding NarL/FixJ family response regulator
MTTGKIHVIVADDHPIFARGLRQVLTADPDVDVVAEAPDGEAALRCIQEHLPDVAVLDVDMPKKDGFEVVREVQARRLPVATIFLTMHKNEAVLNAALDLGVQGFVLKDAALAEVVGSVKAVAAGENFISPALSTFLLARRKRAQTLLVQQPTLDDLSQAERRVLQLIADERTSPEIARELHVSVRTIEHHRANICTKLNFHGSNALLRFAIAHKSELL